ncbi:MAG: hypothetical protein ACE5GE_11110 [Phycisphaerae bacterium]
MPAIIRAALMGVLTGGLAISTVQAQTPADPANDTPKPEAADLSAKVVEVTGDVKTAPTGTSPTAGDAWKPVAVDDLLPAGSLIRTGIRSHLILMFGDNTVINIKRVTLASIDQFYQTQTQQTVRLGLGYGAVRGGSAEGRLRSDVIIDSTVATLAKRGTEGFEMQVEPYTGRFTISLSRQGLVEALQKLTQQRRLVRPGQYTNQLNIAKMWIKQDRFDRQVTMQADPAMTASDMDFTIDNPRGFAAISPGSGNQTFELAGRNPRNLDTRIRRPRRNRPLPLRRADMVVIDRRPIRRPDGNFGVPDNPRILVPVSKRTQAHRVRPAFQSKRQTNRR